MTVKEADALIPGDKAITFNGCYQQNVTVTNIVNDRGVRRISYEWTNPYGQIKTGEKRHTSVYLD